MAAQSQEGPSDSRVQGTSNPRFGEVKIRTRGRLPHWEKEQGLYFLTFHFADSLPKKVLDGIVERQKILAAAKGIRANLLPSQEVHIAEYSPRKIEEYFDRGYGECLLRNPDVASALATALRFWHGKKYRLIAWCIMPNHVHVLCRLFSGQRLSNVVKSWKLYSARETNRLLRRTGTLWQREYYDRLIREGEFDRALQYVLQNPEKAGLRDWPWKWSEGQETLSTAGLPTGATQRC